ncbi:hypothetical protein NDU88_004110 [Pleurodeles waltl]|uniref:Secreted protein n=1 Tax=Pleurodeles waltl TaxID=8319 RepID=A0AAV7RHR3_PLEWA|nr:hypothetical protein NDU88_004110 [Pleurodeles waltl]
MAVGVVTARVQSVLVGVLVMDVVADDVVHASVSGDVTGREEGDEEEGDTEEAVAVGTVRWDLRGDGGMFPCTDRWWTCRQWKKDMSY